MFMFKCLSDKLILPCDQVGSEAMWFGLDDGSEVIMSGGLCGLPLEWVMATIEGW